MTVLHYVIVINVNVSRYSLSSLVLISNKIKKVIQNYYLIRTKMTYITIWEEFEKSAAKLYLRDPLNTRYSAKYSHSKGVFVVKITDNKKCLLYETEVQQDVKKILNFISNLIRHMASNDN